tara:strand:- start:24875 stop:25156 length:282 start_codon:yes stop_codon:yes gene_type:complete
MTGIISTIIIIFLVILLWYCFNFNEIEEILEYRKEKKVKEPILNNENNENTNNLSENLVINNILDKLKKIQTDIDELKLCKNVEDCKDDTRYN